MKRGALGPSPARRTLLWDSTQARRVAQRGHDVAARSKEAGFVAVTGDMSLDQFVRAVGVWKGARNRAACRQGHVMVGRYRAAREAEREIPAPSVIGGDRWEVREDRPAPEVLPRGGASHSGADAIAAILAVHARCVEARG